MIPATPAPPRELEVPASSGAPGVRLVVVPGLGLSVTTWRAALSALGPPADALVVSLPAFGRPAPSGLDVGPVASARRLLERLVRLGPDPVVLFGHSASCQVVAEAARRAPERVRALVLVGPTTDPRAASWPALAGRWLRTAVHERPGQVPLLVRDYTDSGLATMARALHHARHHRIDDALAAAGRPALLVRGRDDRISPAAWLRRIAELTGARVATLPSGAHMVPLTRPEDLAAAVRPFLTDALG